MIIGDRAADSCFSIPVGGSINERIVAKAGCAGVSITEIQILGPAGNTFSNLAQVGGTTDQWFVTVRWTSTAAQAGPNIICAKTSDNAFMASNMHCFTVQVGTNGPSLNSATKTPTGTITQSTSTPLSWYIEFDQAVDKPTTSSFINFYKSPSTLLFKIDVALFPNVVYGNYSVTFESYYQFDDGSYYITFDSGIGLGKASCKAASNAETSSSFWTFNIASTPTTTTLPTFITSTGSSSTLSPIFTTTTTSTSTTSLAITSTSTIAGLTGTSGTTLASGPGASSTTTISGPGASTTTSISGSSTSTTIGTTTTISITPYTTRRFNTTVYTECNRQSFMITLGSIMIGSIILHSTCLGLMMVYLSKR